MLKKEFRDIIKPTLIIMCLILILPLINLLNPDSLIFGYQSTNGKMNDIKISQPFDLYIIAIIITIASGAFGSGMFRSEYKDKAFEYLLSSPIPKTKIITLKVFPRLIVIVLFLIIYISIFLAHPGSDIFSNVSESTFLNPAFFTVWTIFIFFISFFPSIFKQQNWIAVTSLMTLISIFVIPVAIKTVLLRSGIRSVNTDNVWAFSFVTGMFIVFLISAIAFYLTCKNFDLKEQFFQGNKYSIISLIPQVILFVISIIVFIK